MERLERLSLRNKLKIYSTDSGAFRLYGRNIKHDFASLVDWVEANTEVPAQGNVYLASSAPMEQLPGYRETLTRFFGQMEYQIGYCNGNNSTLNGLEYHKSSEINIAVTDMVLLLGKRWEIEGCFYDSAKVEAFFIPKGMAVELYATTLHFAPCKVCDNGFKAIIILPRDTNLPLEDGCVAGAAGEEALLFMKNKWLLAHPSNQKMISNGAFVGISGDNLEVVY